MKKYDTYKDSGIQWIGQVPEHWKIGKIKVLCDSIFAGATPSTGNQEYWEGGSIPWIPSGCCHDCKINEAPKYITEAGLQNSSTKLIPANTTVMALTGATCAQLGYLTIEACANQSVVAFVENKQKADSRFLYYSLFAAREEILTHKSGGAQGGINQEDCRNIQIAIISLSEQQAIADFLDKKTGEIDQAIALFEQEKTDLQAYRKAIISETVTKGLNPNAKLKDSGIQWIGQIPEEWSVRRMKDKYILQTGTTPKGYDSQDEGDELINWFTPADITESGNILNDSQRKISRQVVDDNTISLYPKGSLIFVGIGATAGKLGYSEVEGYSNQQITALIPKDNVQSKYHFYYLMSIKNVLRDTASYTTMPIINNAFLSKESIPLPPLSEQEAIVAYLDKKTSAIDTAIERINAQITELQAYRTALISEAVTGKIDVR